MLIYSNQKAKRKNRDGKTIFIGCSNYREGTTRDHHCIFLAKRKTDESMVKKLFSSGGNKNIHQLREGETSFDNCFHIVHPRSGGKGSSECCQSFYILITCKWQTESIPLAIFHMMDGAIVIGHMVQCQSPARIKILTPIDGTPIVIMYIWVVDEYGGHNHSACPHTKLSFDD